MNFTSGAIYVSRIQHIQLLTFFKPFFSSICAFPSTNNGKQSTIDLWEYFLLICLKMNMKPLHFANKKRGEFQPNHLQIFAVSHCLFRLKVYKYIDELVIYCSALYYWIFPFKLSHKTQIFHNWPTGVNRECKLAFFEDF